MKMKICLMANSILYKSSILSSFLHLYVLYNYPIDDMQYILFILSALLISILNHGYTVRIFMIADRILMCFGLPYTYIRIHENIYSLVCLSSIPIFYMYAKYSKNVYYHLLCHFLITGINIQYIVNYM